MPNRCTSGHDIGAGESLLGLRYGTHEALINLETLEVYVGSLPSRALGLTLEWAALHRPELNADWQRARAKEPLQSIAPLE